MRWDVIVPDWLTLVEGDTEVVRVLGRPPALFMSGQRDRKVNSLEWTLIVPGLETELYETSLVQLDFWTTTMEQLAGLSKALRRLLHHDLPITVGSHKMWSQLVGGRPLAGPDNDGALSHSLDFRLQYLRGKYS